MSTRNYDLIVLGGGIGGYTAAIRAAQAGKTVALVEEDKLGGTCLHRGCIPSKSLLRSAEVFASAKSGSEYGVVAERVELDFSRVMRRKDEIVHQLHTGLESLMKKNRIDVYRGRGRVIGPSIFSPRSGSVAIDADEELPTLTAKHTIIATGSRPRMLPGWEADGEQVLTSDDALRMERLPASMLIIGGGVIGVEWASMMNDFGVQVTIVEAAERLLPQEDDDVSREMERMLAARGVTVLTRTSVVTESLDTSGGRVAVSALCEGEARDLTAEACLVAVGRQANTEWIGLENTDVAVDGGYIRVNEFLQTTEPHIYAIGDVIGGPQLAHKAAYDAMLAVDHLLGRPVEPHAPHRVARCIYSRPEAAGVGLSEREAKAKGHRVKTGKFPFRALGKALVHGSAEGFVKVVADAESDDILGVHIVGAQATELISEAALALRFEAAPWEIGTLAHPHPTLSEALGEAMLAADGRAVSI